MLYKKNNPINCLKNRWQTFNVHSLLTGFLPLSSSFTKTTHPCACGVSPAGQSMWRVSSGGLVSGRGASVRRLWAGLPADLSPLHAVLERKSDHGIIFISGTPHPVPLTLLLAMFWNVWLLSVMCLNWHLLALLFRSFLWHYECSSSSSVHSNKMKFENP